MTTPQIICDGVLVHVAETVFVIPAKAGIQFFALDPCFCRGDIVDFPFPQQILIIKKPVIRKMRYIAMQGTCQCHLVISFPAGMTRNS